MLAQNCPYFPEFDTRCSFTGSHRTSLDDTLIVNYCYKNYPACAKYKARIAEEEKKKADVKKEAQKGQKKPPSATDLADAFGKEIF
jgi:hypothetical protein